MSIPVDELKPEWKQIYHQDTICLMNAEGTGADTIGVASHIIGQYHLCSAIECYLRALRRLHTACPKDDDGRDEMDNLFWYLLDEIFCFHPEKAEALLDTRIRELRELLEKGESDD